MFRRIEGYDETPTTLHLYVYVAADPIDYVDASGNDFGAFDTAISNTINSISVLQFQQTVAALTPIAAATQANRPSSTNVWDNYPNYDWYAAKNVWEKVGGSLGTWGARNSAAGGDYENSCATRVSYALNYSGAEIAGSARSIDPQGFRQNLEKPAFNGNPGDDLWYIVRARTLDKYLKSIWGTPGYVVKNTKDYEDTLSHLDAQHQQIAVFATSRPGGGHSGVIKKGYQDPYILTELPVDVWLLP